MKLGEISVPAQPYGERYSFAEARASSPTFAREFETGFVRGVYHAKRSTPNLSENSNWRHFDVRSLGDVHDMECWELPHESSGVWNHWRIVADGTLKDIKDHAPLPNHKPLPDRIAFVMNGLDKYQYPRAKYGDATYTSLGRDTSDPAKFFMRIKPTETLAEKLMPKLDEIHGLLAGETHAKVIGIDHAVHETQAEFPEIKENLNLIRKKSGRADARLDQMEDHVIELDSKLDALRDDVREIKSALAEI